MPLITIDGRPLEVEAGTLIIQAADRLGVEIPRFCYHPDLRPEGNCRICLVRAKGYPRPIAACSTPVADGMVIQTAHSDEETRRAVNGVLEFLLINHPLDCPICDQSGECALQDFYMNPDYGLHDSQVDPPDKVRKRKAIDLGPMVVLDSERCVMCSRCVRFSREVSGYGELEFVDRGDHVELKAFADRALVDPYAGNLVDICPVGALTSRDFRFKRRVWYLASAPSICPGCSTGCNVRIDHFAGNIERVIPRRNPAVNASWICDEGRLGHRRLASLPRVLAPSVSAEGSGRAETTWDAALDAAAAGLGSGTVGRSEGPTNVVLGSCTATNEALWLVRHLAGRAGDHALADARLAEEDRFVDAREDQLLRRADKHANTRGAALLGLAGPGSGGLGDFVELAQAGRVGTAVILYYPPFVRDESAEVAGRLRTLVQEAAFSIVLTSHWADWWAEASVVLPIATWAEEEGTYTNFAGRVQHAAAAFPPPSGVRTAVEALADLLAATGLDIGDRRPEGLFGQLAAGIPAYSGCTYGNLISRLATAYPPEGRMSFGKEGVSGH